MINLAGSLGQKFVNSVFSGVYKHYDKANDLMSFGLHRLWKKDFCNMLNVLNNDSVLDLASGTGDIAKILIQKTQNITLCDVSEKMLSIAKKRINGGNFVVADAKNLPFENNKFDFITCVFGIRNFQEVELSIKEAHRVLKSGGVFAIMEFMPSAENPLIDRLYHTYIKNVIPKYDLIFNSKTSSYDYFSKSILQFKNKKSFVEILESYGFSVVTPSKFYGSVGVFLCKKS